MMRSCWVGSLFSLSLAAAAFAQTGAPLLLTPWQRPAGDDTEARYEFDASGLSLSEADLDEPGEELTLGMFESRGRMKLTDTPGAGPAVGFEARHYDLNTDSPALPDRLVDVSVAAAVGVPLGDGAWDAGLVAGVGYAGTTPFADSDAVYLMGDLVFKRDLDATSSLTFALSYDGNRTFLPDLPLPGGYYARRVSDRFAFTVGLPYSSVRWSPADRWTVTARASAFALPFIADVTVDYALAGHLTLYAAFESRRSAFWLEDADNQRIFLQQRRLEAGVRYIARDGVTLLAAGGWAFDQEFETGWDIRDTDDLRELDDAPYLRLALDFAF